MFRLRPDRQLRLCRTRRWCGAWLLPLFLAGLAAGSVGCQQDTLTTNESGVLQLAATPGTGATVQLAALDAADFEIVDCELPARVKRLGRQLTFLDARRPVRTTGQDCAIRGGEYVAYDRANYATALKIWLPLAEQGDPEAQTYVGDIYEKGLGLSPDYAVAANWYRRAAEQGYATAQVSLGQLYERGLGVRKDMVAALDLYRRASGLDEAFEIVPVAELQTLQGQLDQSQRKAETHGQQIEILQQELRQARNELQELRAEAEAEQQSLELARRQLAEQRESLAIRLPRSEFGGGDEQAARARQVEMQQPERGAELARRSEELNRRVAEIAAREWEHQQKAATERTSIQVARRELQAAQSELAEQKARLDAEIRQLQMQREWAADEQAARTGQVEAAYAEVRDDRAMLEEREAALVRRSEELERQAAQIAARQAEHQQSTATERISIQAAQLELEAAHSELAERKARLDSEIRQLQLQRERAADQQTIERRQVEAESAAVREHRAMLEEREAALVRRSEELERQAAEVSAREAEHRETATTEWTSVQDAQRQLHAAQRELAAQRAEFETDMRELKAQREGAAEERATQTRHLEALHAELREEHAALEQREADLARRTEDLNLRMSEIRIKETEVKHKQDELAELNPQIRELDESLQQEAVIDYGKYYALVIGNENYQSTLDMQPLKSPEADAKAIAGLLSQKYGYTVIPLIDASRDQILGAMNTLRETLTEQDNLLIYYAGHGFLDEDNSRGYWIPVDAEPYPQTGKWISTNDITDILNSMRAKHVLVVADSCYSGALAAPDNAPLGLGVPEEERVYWLKTIANKPARMALTSGNLSPVLDSGGGQHSIFAMALLEVLGTNDRVMEGWRVYVRVSARVSDVAQVYGLRQVPTYGPIKSEKYAGGDFLFVRG